MRRAATMDFNLSAAQRRLQGEARALAQSELAGRAAAIDRSEEYPWENVRLLKEAGFFGITIPTRYGGPGLTYFDVVLVIQHIAPARRASGPPLSRTPMCPPRALTQTCAPPPHT